MYRVESSDVISGGDLDELKPDELERPQRHVQTAPDLQSNTTTLRVEFSHVVNVDVEPFNHSSRQ